MSFLDKLRGLGERLLGGDEGGTQVASPFNPLLPASREVFVPEVVPPRELLGSVEEDNLPLGSLPRALCARLRGAGANITGASYDRVRDGSSDTYVSSIHVDHKLFVRFQEEAMIYHGRTDPLLREVVGFAEEKDIALYLP